MSKQKLPETKTTEAEAHITRRSLNDRRRGNTDWAAVDRQTDEQIAAYVAADPDAAPILTSAEIASFELKGGDAPFGPAAAVTFLVDAARYFDNRPAGGEDSAHWSNRFNAENCRRIAALIVDQAAEIAKLTEALSRLSFAAQTTGGTAGPDAGLQAAIAQAEAVLGAILVPVSTFSPGLAGLADVVAERRRQIEAEGWTPEHDEQHGDGELALAAASYIQGSFYRLPDHAAQPMPVNWPWGQRWWKPKNPRRDLVRAGALILAELDRMDRAAAKATGTAVPKRRVQLVIGPAGVVEAAAQVHVNQLKEGGSILTVVDYRGFTLFSADGRILHQIFVGTEMEPVPPGYRVTTLDGTRIIVDGADVAGISCPKPNSATTDSQSQKGQD